MCARDLITNDVHLGSHCCCQDFPLALNGLFLVQFSFLPKVLCVARIFSCKQLLGRLCSAFEF